MVGCGEVLVKLCGPPANRPLDGSLGWRDNPALSGVSAKYSPAVLEDAPSRLLEHDQQECRLH